MPSIIIMDVWKNTGFAMLIFLAGLQNIPDMYYEAAQLDGANRWQPFRHVTLPLISPTIFFNLIIFMIGALQVFDSIIQWLIFRRIALPLAGPSLAALAILTFNTTWNNYFYPLVFLNTVENMTLPLGITALRGSFGSGNPSVVMAAISMTILPILLVFLLAQRWFIAGVTQTGLKG